MDFPKVSLETFRENYDMPLEKFFRGMGVSENHLHRVNGEFKDVFHDNYEPLADECELRSGARELLSASNDNGLTQVVLSNHLVAPICRQMDRFSIRPFFAEIIAGLDRKSQFGKKSKGEKLKDYMDANGLKPQETAIVGDSPEEIIIAKNLGLTSFALIGGHSSEKRLRRENPDYLVQSLSEIEEILRTRGTIQ
jgi:phosphoglycolate phosphatase-like HAD superfamily hydrolase